MLATTKQKDVEHKDVEWPKTKSIKYQIHWAWACKDSDSNLGNVKVRVGGEDGCVLTPNTRGESLGMQASP